MKQRKFKNILVTGGAGFIGSNFIRYMLEKATDFDGRIINLDALTYAGNLMNLSGIETRYGQSAAMQEPRYVFIHGNICDRTLVESLFEKYEIDTVVNFAAESHVERSVLGPGAFVETNVLGTFTLLEAARGAWVEGGMRSDALFHHISTDEVYGSLGETGCFTENSPYDPRSPYSASKAASDHLVMAYFHTYGLPVTLSNCSNNYGPRQFPEKLIPFMILNILEGKSLSIHGDGKYIRDWLYVEDHNNAVWTIMRNGGSGGKYNIGGENQWENFRLLNLLIDITAPRAGLDPAKVRETVTFVKDRKSNDRRYSIDCSRLKHEFGWKQEVNFDEGLVRTVEWYLENPEWIKNVRGSLV